MSKAPGLSDFEGVWTLTRRIEDRLAGAEAALDGQASFSPAGDGLRYEEQGVLRHGDQPPLDARRSYFWREVEGRIEVLFDDGRPFHQIAADKLMPDDLHHCAPDMYHVSYDFSKWPKWRAIWRVQGPRKDYRSVSDYRRV